ncbi:hypothetical protein EDC96DRAFT_444404 [Choanephora cucurbitarum]|nr:hypothetical protein EDC96DRAFT_444404 [Choanephora cucurbitarum]
MIENKYASLVSLIDTIYPPLLCTLCDTVFTTKNASSLHFIEKHNKKSRYICIHPHCDRRFVSKGALRFHISRSHLVMQAKKPLPDPPLYYQPTIQKKIKKTKKTSNHASPILSDISLKHEEEEEVDHHHEDDIDDLIIPSSPLSSCSSLSSVPDSPLLQSTTSVSPTPLSPFSLYHRHKKTSSKKPTLSAKAEQFLNSIYPPLQCPSCNQLFGRKTNVIKHLTEAHIGQEPYRCIYPSCNHPRLYATREGLVYHIVHAHDKIK